jgi:glycosyltransferase involved in cell wall biosynthesis
MPKCSIITPLHKPGNLFIGEAYDSLVSQTMTDWEWIVLQNNGGELPNFIKEDSRVRVLSDDSGKGIGFLKRQLSNQAGSEIIVELDNDDILEPTALDKIVMAFADKNTDFVYSDFAEFKMSEDGSLVSSWPEYPYGALYGWSSYEVDFRGSKLNAMRAPDATAHTIRLVDWAPNHVRAWRKRSYFMVGGHNPRLSVADDHDLIVRMFLNGANFVKIPECLYFYRVHTENTVGTKNAEIREGTWRVYNQNIWKLAEKWSDDNSLSKIDLCGGIDCPDKYTPLDESLGTDLNDVWPLDDSTVGVLRAHDAIEHLKNPVHTMNEAYRVLAPGGWLMISVPSSNGLGAFCDPTHVSFWNKLSFRYYTNPNFSKYLPKYFGRFQVARVIEWFPSDWHKENNVPYVEAQLICCKDGFRAMGEYLWPPPPAVGLKAITLSPGQDPR